MMRVYSKTTNFNTKKYNQKSKLKKICAHQPSKQKKLLRTQQSTDQYDCV